MVVLPRCSRLMVYAESMILVCDSFLALLFCELVVLNSCTAIGLHTFMVSVGSSVDIPVDSCFVQHSSLFVY